MRRVVAVLLYPDCAFFEIALAAEVLAAHFEILYFTPEGAEHRASNGALLQPAGGYGELPQRDPAAVLIPGGDPGSIMLPENRARDGLLAAAEHGALLAGICAGNLVLASTGLLRGKKGTHNYTPEHAPPGHVEATRHIWEGMVFVRANVVVDGSFITAQPWAYRDYAAAVAQQLGVLSADRALALRDYAKRGRAADGPIAAVLLYVPDVRAATAWYERALVGARRTSAVARYEYLDVDGVMLEIVPADEKVANAPAGTVVYWHAPDFAAALRQLLDAGATLYRGPLDIEGGQTMCQVRDPWGNCIGLRGPRTSE